MTTEEKMQLLEIWERRTEHLDDEWEEFSVLTGAGSESPFGDAIWRMWGDYTEAVARLLDCDPSGLSWYYFDNQLGAKELQCTCKAETRKICDVEDLAWMLEIDQDS